jgi:D-amino-acid dehydrogenase
MHVCVLGAGIVGLATAYELSRQGFEVTVVDRATSGAGASGGNGAQLSYSYVQPLADASVWMQLPKLLLSPDSPLKIKPQWDMQQWRWGLAFLRACNARTSARSTASLLILAAQSRASLDRMLATENLDCDYSSTGKLVLYPNAQALAAAQRQMALQSALGSQQQAVTAQACCDLEPALAAYQQQIAGAIYTPSECAIDCLKLCRELERVLRNRGVRFTLGTSVHALEQRAGRVVAAHTSQGSVEAHQFVLALGCDSVLLAHSVGISLPVYPIKGYSITLDVEQAGHAAPRINVTDAARKVVFARIGQRLRVAGMAELVGYDRSVQSRSINSLQRSTQTVFPQLAACVGKQPWAGLRPATPTGLPIVGVQAGGPSNLVINTGHGALGLTLAFGTAQRVVQGMQHPATHAEQAPSVTRLHKRLGLPLAVQSFLDSLLHATRHRRCQQRAGAVDRPQRLDGYGNLRLEC